MAKKNILIVTHVKPYPIDSGGSSGVFFMVENLKEDYNFTIIYPVKENEYKNVEKLKKLWPRVNVQPYYQPDGKVKYIQKLKRTIKTKISIYKENTGNDPDFDIKRRSCIYQNNFAGLPEKLITHIKNVLSSQQFDMCQIEYFPYIKLVDILPKNTVNMFVHHELRFVRAQRELDLFENQTKNDTELYKNIYKQEIATLKKYDKIIALTNIDADFLAKHIDKENIFISPSTIKPIAKNKEDAFQFKNKLVFMGGSGHFPNVDAIDWFLNNVWNKILQEKPELTLNVTGKWENRYLKKFSGFKNVTFVGYVDDLKTVIDGSIMIVPIRIGSGMRMKILDAVHWGIPFVTTTIGVEGLDFINEQDCFVSDSPEGFKNMVVNLINNGKQQQLFVANSHKKYLLKYDTNIAVRTRKEIYTKILQEKYLLT